MSDERHEEAGTKPIVRFVSETALREAIEDGVEAAIAPIMSSADFPAIWQMLKAHDKILRGNGRPGLVEEVAVIKPMVPKLETHLKSFIDFEVQTKLDRQTFFSRFDQIEKKVDDGITGIKESIKPLTDLYNKMTRGAVAIGFFAFLAGGLIMFLFEKGGKIMEFMKWMTTK
jgi:hypothetical protein